MLNIKEYKLLGKWLDSPWCNSNKKLCELHQILKKHHPDFDSKKLSKNWLFSKLYPDKKYNPSWMRNINSELLKQVESFFIHQQLENNKDLQKFLIRAKYLECNIKDEFNIISQEMIKTVESRTVKSWLDFFQLAYLYEESYFQPNSSAKVESGKTILNRAEEYLDTFYAIGKYRILNEYSEREKILLEPNDLNQVLNLMHTLFSHLDLTTLKLYQKRLEKLNESPLEKYFFSKELFLQNRLQLPLKEQKIFLMSLINDASNLKVQGQQEMLTEVFELFKIGLDTKLLINNDQITDRSFTNIITISNLLSNADFALHFIKDYTALLPLNIQADARTWGIAHTYYYLKELEKPRDLLAQYSFSNSTFAIQGKLLLFQIYFDLNLFEDNFHQSFIDFSYAAEKFFRRNKVLSKARKQAYINLILYARNISNHLHEKEIGQQKIKEWAKKITQNQNLHGRIWLNERIEQILSRRQER